MNGNKMIQLRDLVVESDISPFSASLLLRGCLHALAEDVSMETRLKLAGSIVRKLEMTNPELANSTDVRRAYLEVILACGTKKQIVDVAFAEGGFARNNDPGLLYTIISGLVKRGELKEAYEIWKENRLDTDNTIAFYLLKAFLSSEIVNRQSLALSKALYRNDGVNSFVRLSDSEIRSVADIFSDFGCRKESKKLFEVCKEKEKSADLLNYLYNSVVMSCTRYPNDSLHTLKELVSMHGEELRLSANSVIRAKMFVNASKESKLSEMNPILDSLDFGKDFYANEITHLLDEGKSFEIALLLDEVKANPEKWNEVEDLLVKKGVIKHDVLKQYRLLSETLHTQSKELDISSLVGKVDSSILLEFMTGCLKGGYIYFFENFQSLLTEEGCRNNGELLKCFFNQVRVSPTLCLSSSCLKRLFNVFNESQNGFEASVILDILFHCSRGLHGKRGYFPDQNMYYDVLKYCVEHGNTELFYSHFSKYLSFFKGKGSTRIENLFLQVVLRAGGSDGHILYSTVKSIVSSGHTLDAEVAAESSLVLSKMEFYDEALSIFSAIPDSYTQVKGEGAIDLLFSLPEKQCREYEGVLKPYFPFSPRAESGFLKCLKNSENLTTGIILDYCRAVGRDSAIIDAAILCKERHQTSLILDIIRSSSCAIGRNTFSLLIETIFDGRWDDGVVTDVEALQRMKMEPRRDILDKTFRQLRTMANIESEKKLRKLVYPAPFRFVNQQFHLPDISVILKTIGNFEYGGLNMNEIAANDETIFLKEMVGLNKDGRMGFWDLESNNLFQLFKSKVSMDCLVDQIKAGLFPLDTLKKLIKFTEGADCVAKSLLSLNGFDIGHTFSNNELTSLLKNTCQTGEQCTALKVAAFRAEFKTSTDTIWDSILRLSQLRRSITENWLMENPATFYAFNKGTIEEKFVFLCKIFDTTNSCKEEITAHLVKNLLQLVDFCGLSSSSILFDKSLKLVKDDMPQHEKRKICELLAQRFSMSSTADPLIIMPRSFDAFTAVIESTSRIPPLDRKKCILQFNREQFDLLLNKLNSRGVEGRFFCVDVLQQMRAFGIDIPFVQYELLIKTCLGKTKGMNRVGPRFDTLEKIFPWIVRDGYSNELPHVFGLYLQCGLDMKNTSLLRRLTENGSDLMQHVDKEQAEQLKTFLFSDK